MAIFHSTTKIIGRSSGRSSVGASAYRSGEKIKNEYDGVTSNYSKRQDVIYKEIFLPDNAPKEFTERAKLWNEVEKAEKRKDSQLAREIELALPIELTREENIDLLKAYVKDNFVARGMCADVCYHNGHKHSIDNLEDDRAIKKDNPHAHILLTTRKVNENGFGQKNRDWNKKELVKEHRQDWANKVNFELEKKGFTDRIDPRSYQEQGIKKKPTIKMGKSACEMEKKGVKTIKGDINREIIELNNSMIVLNNQLKQLEAQENELLTLYKVNETKGEKESENKVFKKVIYGIQDNILIKQQEELAKELEQVKKTISGFNQEKNSIEKRMEEITERRTRINDELALNRLKKDYGIKSAEQIQDKIAELENKATQEQQKAQEYQQELEAIARQIEQQKQEELIQEPQLEKEQQIEQEQQASQEQQKAQERESQAYSIYDYQPKNEEELEQEYGR